MNKLSLITIVVLTLAISACASNAFAMAASPSQADNIVKAASEAGNKVPVIEKAIPFADGHTNTSWSGDDLYDPAAGAVLENILQAPAPLTSGNYSGDDAYDPAAGGLGW